ncbi:lysosomal alpha-glucosidase [Trichonephila clavata]|uniref:Lysosomal alpha-glucosidase n=1 Tax=Trichonephila clavata TaxID=2740835 RepID=A0A8X6FSR5_TRICU|nr:lysosomal alpha-glucosidase [Trichonephila clavata]
MDKGNYTFINEESRSPSTKRKIIYICAVVVIGFGVGTLLFYFINGESFRSHGKGGSKPDTCSIPDVEKFDCHPDRPISEAECLKRGCCYIPASDLSVKDSDLTKSSFLGVPSCFFSRNHKGYEIDNIIKDADHIEATLSRNISSGFPKDVQKVHLNITFIDNVNLRIKLTDADSNRFEPDIPLHYKIVHKRNELYTVELGLDGLLSVKRKATGAIIFKTNLSQLVFSNQFLHLSSHTASSYLYGLGEQKEGILRSFNWMRYTIFNQGDLPVPHRNLYGSHPFYLVLEPNGNANGVFLVNSNAMDAVLQPTPAISLRTIGGVLDFFVMLGLSPSDVVEQYTSIVGRPFMVPYWSLGFHLCKYGYDSLDNTNETLQRNLDKGVPIDVQWNDIDFMKRYLDFTYDPVNFAKLPEFVDDLHARGMHYVAMFSPGVSNSEEPDTYPPYDEAAKLDLFVKNATGSDFEAKVWNWNLTVFPDFSNPATPSYWAKQFQKYHSELKFDGIWLDMNEPLNFKNGSEHGCPDDEIENPQYLPGRPYPLCTLTICMTAKHHSTIHYNEHNLVAYREAHATFDAIKEIRQKRPFIISRASFAGQGVHSGHWSGDITSDWEDMRYTIPSMLLFNMYGMPMIGSDICGFRLNTTEDLCTKWQALGAFYPFSRNHNDFDTIDQDPAAMGPNVLKATKDNLYTRYYLLPYFYTLFHRSHVYGETTVRPLFFEFPDDKNTYDLNEQFLWGPAVLILPALHNDTNEINPYYPKGLWYDFYSGEKFISIGEHRSLQLELTEIKVAVRGGYVLPLQIPANTTTESRKNAFDLLVTLDENQKAIGELYWDDGDSLDTYENGVYNEIIFSVKNDRFNSTVNKKGYDTTMNLNEIKVYGLFKGPDSVTINGKSGSFEYRKPILVIKVENHTLLQELEITWKY